VANAKTSLFPLPDSRVIETVYVRLEDGRIVARTPDELAALPPDQPGPVVIARSQT
jgi:hypothetical protein